MPRDGYESVTVGEQDYERASDYKPDGCSWGEVLVAGAERLNENLDGDMGRPDDREEIRETLSKLREEVANIPARTSDELEGRLR